MRKTSHSNFQVVGVGFLSYIFGAIISSGGVSLLLIGALGMTTSINGKGVVVFEGLFSLMILLGIVSAASFPLLFTKLKGLELFASLFQAIFLYGLTLTLIAPSLSVMNDCAVGIAFPLSVVGCD